MSTRAYHRVEHERRFLLAALPEPLRSESPHELCTDLYLPGLRMRLRSLIPSDGSEPTFKLGQKFRAEGHLADQRQMTTFYLTAAEHASLSATFAEQAHRLVKRRYRTGPFAIDVFAEHCDGLILADLELADPAELRSYPIPAFALREVTADPRYEGGSLAAVGLP